LKSVYLLHGWVRHMNAVISYNISRWDKLPISGIKVPAKLIFIRCLHRIIILPSEYKGYFDPLTTENQNVIRERWTKSWEIHSKLFTQLGLFQWKKEM